MANTLTPESIDLADARSLLVIKPSSLGDIVHTLPAIALIRRAHPHLKIHWVARTEFMPLLEGNPDLESTIDFPRSQMRGATGVFKLLSWSKRTLGGHDIVIDFQGLARSGAMCWRSGAEQTIGLSDSREGAKFFHRWIVPVDATGHAVDRYLEVPRALGIDCTDAADLFRLPDGTPPTGVDLPGEPYVMLHPFSRGQGKSLTSAQVQTLCEHLAPLPVVLVGRTDEKIIPQRDGVIDLLNQTTIAELIAVTRRASFVISVDSGPMHIASAISDSLISIHTWSDPRKVGPYAPGAQVWKGGSLQRVADYQSPTNTDRLPDTDDLKTIADAVLDHLN